MMGAWRSTCSILLPLALLALLAPPMSTAPTAESCARGCQCSPMAGSDNGTLTASCSSPAAAAALGASLLSARVHKLRLTRHNDHLSVKEGAFRSLGGLRSLHLDHLGLVKVYPGAFRGLDHLEELDLSHNALSAGDEVSRALQDLPQLRRLSLRGNNFGSTHGTAPSLVSRTLKFVDLGRCKIREFSQEMLGRLTHLRHIVLDGNFIRSFNADTFPQSVVSLDLSNNDIDRISHEELSKLENVDAIELSGNPVYCSCDLLQISYNYNINKPVVCAAPKRLMGKHMMDLKKNEVCGGHKKVKREAGNELDDENLSQENDDEYDDNTQRGGDAKNTVSETTGKEESSVEETGKSSHDIVGEDIEQGEVEKSLSVNEDSQKGDISPMKTSVIAEDLEDDEDDTGEEDSVPENIYGEQQIDRSVETETDVAEITNSHGDRIVSDDKAEIEHADQESREEILFSQENKQVPVDEETDDDYESEETNDGSNTDVLGGEIAPAEDVGVGGPSSDDVNERNSQEHKKQNPYDDVYNMEDENGLPAVNDSSVPTENGSDASEHMSGNKEEIREDGDTISQEENPPESLSPSEYINLEAVRKEEKEGNDNSKTKEVQDIEEKTESDDDVPVISHSDLIVPQQTRPKMSASEELNANMEPVDDEDESVNHDDNLLTGNNEEEKSKEDKYSTGSETRDSKGEVDIFENGDTMVSESDPQPDDHVVETIEDSENVVHTSDVGARAEVDDTSEPNREGNDEDKESSFDVAPLDDIVEASLENSEDDVGKSATETEDIGGNGKISDELEIWNEHSFEEVESVTQDEEEESTHNSETSGARSGIASAVDEGSDDKTLKEELEKDRKHSTLSHSDLTDGKDDEYKKETNVEEENESIINNDSVDGLIRHSLNNIHEEERMDRVTLDEDDSESSVEDKDILVMPGANDGFIENHFENVKEEWKEGDAPGERIEQGFDTEDSKEEEGSGAIYNTPVTISHDREADWTDDNEWNESENEAVPPLENAESKEEDEEDLDSQWPGNTSDDSVDEQRENTESPNDFLDSVNVTEGSGMPVNGLLPEGEGGDNTSVESGYGSGAHVPFVNIPEHTGTEPRKDKGEEEEEGSGHWPYIPVYFPDVDESSKTEDDTPEENVYDRNEADKFPITSPAPIVEEDIFPRAKAPVQSSPPRSPVLGRSNIPDDADYDAKKNEKENDGAVLNPMTTNDVVKPVAPPEDEVDKIYGVEGDSGKKHEDVLAAVPPSESASDGSEALNKENALTLNTIGSYVVLGAIMLIVVILLSYAVCRSRRQKSSPTKEQDLENPGREMQDVNKPLINNHHPPTPEKQPLDETQQPLMTKEQEASLSVEQEKTALTDDAIDHKPKQNGVVPEVVVECSAPPITNGKAVSPAAVHTPLPAAPPSPTAPPATSPIASPPHSPVHSSSAANGSVVPMVNGDTHSAPRVASPIQTPASSPAAGQPPVSPGAVRVVAKELPDSVAKRPVIIMNRGSEPAQQV